MAMVKQVRHVCVFMWLLCLCEAPALCQELPDAWLEEEGAVARLELWEDAALQPLELNSVSAEELHGLGMLTAQQVVAIIAWREETGPFQSVYELQAIPGLSPRQLPLLARVLWVHPPVETLRTEGTVFLMRYQGLAERARGYGTGSGYLGNPGTWYMRAQYRGAGPWRAGWVLQQDAGEPWQRPDGGVGVDYAVGHLSWNGKGVIKELVLGHFRPGWGQGLMLGAGFTPGKGGDVIGAVLRPRQPLRAYTSTVESGFWQGGGIRLGLPYGELTAIASAKRIDARLDTVEGDVLVRSLPSSGYHRSASEMFTRRRVGVFSGGLHYTFSSSVGLPVHAGVYGVIERLGLPYVPVPQPYRVHYWQGQQWTAWGTHVRVRLPNGMAFGEWVWQPGADGVGWLAGAVLNLGYGLEGTVLWRNYPEGLHAPYSRAFAEQSLPRNEQGMYWGLRWRPPGNRHWVVQGYYDVFRFPWLRFGVPAPGVGHEALLRTQWRYRKRWELNGQIRYEQKMVGAGDGYDAGFLDGVVPQGQWRYKLWWQATVTRQLAVQFRWHGSQTVVGNASSQGMAVAVDAAWKGRYWALAGRYALFDTDGYTDRQYLYERHVRYAFTFPSFQGQGHRWYLLAQAKPGHGINVQARLARLHRYDVQQLGSGQEQLPGPVRTELTVQVLYSL